jgi:hypothetical protein
MTSAPTNIELLKTQELPNRENDDDDDPVQLSAETLAVLNEFLREQQQETSTSIGEDWQLSQFWYDDETTRILTQECRK